MKKSGATEWDDRVARMASILCQVQAGSHIVNQVYDMQFWHVTYSPLLDYQEGDLIAKKSLYLGG